MHRIAALTRPNLLLVFAAQCCADLKGRPRKTTLNLLARFPDVTAVFVNIACLISHIYSRQSIRERANFVKSGLNNDMALLVDEAPFPPDAYLSPPFRKWIAAVKQTFNHEVK